MRSFEIDSTDAWARRAHIRRLLRAATFFATLGLFLGLLPPRVLTADDDSTAAGKVLFLGDSLAAGYGLAREEALPERLEGLLRAAGLSIEVVNAGVSGDTTAGGRSRLDWLLEDRPSYVVVELGGNDGLRGIEPSATRENLDAILANLQERGIPAMLAGMYAPPNLGEDYEREFNSIFPELAEKYGVDFYPFILDGVALNPELQLPDGIHPNAKGVEVMAKGLAAALVPIFQATDPEEI